MDSGERLKVRGSMSAKMGRAPARRMALAEAKKLLAGSDAAVVWASRNGEAVGHRVSPLHRKAPEAAQKNPRLYDLLTLLDAIRIGGAREREVASREIRARLT